MRLTVVVVLMSSLSAFVAVADEAPQSAPPCGFSPTDWCPSPAGDPCGIHLDEAACQADAACVAMPYRGESVIACIPDSRGFASNCPAVGCTSVPPAK